MEIFLQSRDKHNDIAILNLASGTFSIYSKPDRPELSSKSINGYFSFVDGKLICFFRSAENLTMKADSEVITFVENDELFLESQGENQFYFRVQRGEDIIFSLNYERRPISPSIGAYEFFNPMITEEEFDIFLFMCNAFNDRGRRERVFRSRSVSSS